MSVQQDVAVAKLTTTEAAVLSLLAIEGEHSAYDLVKLVERAIAHVWAPARSGLYAVLPRLVAAGLASSRPRARRGRREVQLYSISADGRRALEAWLRTVEAGARESFFLKLFVGKLTEPEILLEHVAQFCADTAEHLAVLRAI